jgi:hypothetical protein
MSNGMGWVNAAGDDPSQAAAFLQRRWNRRSFLGRLLEMHCVLACRQSYLLLAVYARNPVSVWVLGFKDAGRSK